MAAALPNWMMLEHFVLCRDDPESFPGDEAAPFTVSSSTSQGDPFRVAFLVAEPPAISRLYVQWPRGGLDPEIGFSCDLVTAHRDLVLFRLTCKPVTFEGSPFPHYQQDYFICKASSSPLLLKRIPVCTEPVVVRVKNGKELTMPRSFYLHTLGLQSHDSKEDFAMAQLDIFTHGNSKPTGELCLLRSRLSDDDYQDYRWEVKQRLHIHYREEELLDLLYWKTDKAIPFKHFLCWANYYRGGILFCDVLEEMPKLFYLRMPIDRRPQDTSQHPFFELRRSVCVTEGGLKFVDVSGEDGELLGPMEPGTGFTITCHTLNMSESGCYMKWDKDFSITSEDLWDCNGPAILPRCVLMCPLVSMDRPNLVHFLCVEYSDEYGDEFGKVSSVSIDTNTKAVDFILPYIEGDRDLHGKDADMVEHRSHFLQSFLPSEFPKFLNEN